MYYRRLVFIGITQSTARSKLCKRESARISRVLTFFSLSLSLANDEVLIDTNYFFVRQTKICTTNTWDIRLVLLYNAISTIYFFELWPFIFGFVRGNVSQ